MRILGIIPARGGSKGIPRKNLIDISGKPLVYWSIKTGNELLRNGTLHRCIISTDDDEIASVAKNFGADVPFIRPVNISGDKAKSSEFVTHALHSIKVNGEFYDSVMILQPTSPIRDTKKITKAVLSFYETDADSLISCYEEHYVNKLVMYKKGLNGRIVPCHPDHNKGVRRQEIEPTIIRNGAVYITKTKFFRAKNKLVCDNPYLLLMSKAHSVDLDTPDDLLLLRAMMCKLEF